MDAHTRIKELVYRYLDQGCSEAELAELNHLLAEDASAAAIFAEASRLDGGLSTALGHEESSAKVQAILLEAGQTSTQQMSRHSRRLAWSIVAAAVVVLAAATLFLLPKYSPRNRSETQTAANDHSEVVSGGVLVDGNRVETIRDGSAVRVVGKERAVISLSDGSQVDLEPGANVVLRGNTAGPRQLIELVEGGGTFRIKKAEGKFQVVTRLGKVTALGTEFSVKLVPAENQGDSAMELRSAVLAVAVVVGVVQVEADGETTILNAGENQVFAPAGAEAGVAAAKPTEPQGPRNLLRNGSFEGGLLYWHGIEPDKQRLVHGDTAVGEYALRIEKGYVMSAPFVAKRGEPCTVSFFIKGDKPGEASVGMPPSAREVGTKAKRLWCREGGQIVKFDTQWRRVSCTWKADVPEDGFWPYPHYLVQIGDSGVPICVDGVTVTQGQEGTKEYLPRSKVEVVADCPDLPGYAGGRANLLERGASPRVTAHVSNPGEKSCDVMLRWQLMDYEGQQAVGKAIEKRVTIPAGKTFSESVPMKLTANGMVLARVSAWEGTTDLDQSDFPLTSLPYPKAATKPDGRERFGGSFAGGIGCVEKFQRIGFGWIRWRPHSNGEDHLPKEPAAGEAWQWTWFDKELDEQESHGCSSHLVLYPPPKWIMEKDNPLPKDMRWKANDPRWDDLKVETVWDKFIKEAVAHYRGRAVLYEIENEPEFDHWDDLKDEYVRFTIRTARLIKQTDAKAKVMVDNVYGIPSGLNAVFFKAGGLKYIDAMSWHDYHEGWLTDAAGIRRMRQNMDEAGGKDVELWFNEGWAYTNTAVDEPIACTHLTSAQSTNAIIDSVAEVTVNGQDKTVLFHTAYEEHGMSFWDYSGPGTMLWDWYNNPLPLAAAWNVLAHHIGISERIAFVRPTGANLCIFQDLRNGRGVIIAYADRDAKADVKVPLPDFKTPLTAEDIMGNTTEASRTLLLSKTGRPVILYAANGKIGGQQFAERLASLDRKNASFVTADAAGAPEWKLPASWDGKEKGCSEGSVAMAEGKPVWKLEQVWPPEWKKRENFHPMVWTGIDWNVKEGGFGGQPGASLNGHTLNFGTRAPHGTPQLRRVAGVTFVAQKAGFYRLSGTASCRIWDGTNKTVLRLLHKSADGVQEAGHVSILHEGIASLGALSVAMAAGDEFTLLPEIDGAFSGGDCKLEDLRVKYSETPPATDAGGPAFRLPLAWEGVKKGSADGNPIKANGKPVWRIDRVYPDKVIMAENYAPMPWDGTAWHSEDHQQGGQPSATVADGTAKLSVSGPWKGIEFQKIAGLVFLAPKDGVYRVRGSAYSKPWTGDAKLYRLAVLKKDTQRAAEVEKFDLPRDGKPVEIDFEVELTAGHELVFLPLMPDWNNATTTTIEDLKIEQTP